MASSRGPQHPIQLFVPHQPWSRQALAWSGALHLLIFVLAGWVGRGRNLGAAAIQPEQVSRAYAVQYLALVPSPNRLKPRPARPPASRPPAPVPSATAPPATRSMPTATRSMPTAADSATRIEPHRPALQLAELALGSIMGLGRVVPKLRSDAPGRGIAGILGLQVPGPGDVASVRRGLDQVAELVEGAGSACPELRRPAAWPGRQVAVAVAFVVDTNGRVDPKTLQVIESPDRPQTANRFHSRIYIVGAKVRVDRIDPAAYDSLVTHEVASHVADLMFRPALREGRAMRSTVLVSCQTS
jgi:hypothetical protein